MLERNDELKHYGVIGMKWGVRRARKASSTGKSEKARKLYSKHYSKATSKADEINRKAINKNLKAAKLRRSALNKESKATNERQYDKARKQQFEANKLDLKAAKLQKKAMKWVNRMENTLSDVPFDKIDNASIEKGKKYTYMLMRDKVVDKKAAKESDDYWKKAMESRDKGDDKKSVEYERKSLRAELKSLGYSEEEIKKMHLP